MTSLIFAQFTEYFEKQPLSLRPVTDTGHVRSSAHAAKERTPRCASNITMSWLLEMRTAARE